MFEFILLTDLIIIPQNWLMNNVNKEDFDPGVQWFLQHLICLNFTNPFSFIFHTSTARGYFSLSRNAFIFP